MPRGPRQGLDSEMAVKALAVSEAQAPTAFPSQNSSKPRLSFLCWGHRTHSVWHTPAFLLVSQPLLIFQDSSVEKLYLCPGLSLHLVRCHACVFPRGPEFLCTTTEIYLPAFLYQSELRSSIHFHKTGSQESTVLGNY